MSKNNLRGILVRGPIWGIHSLILIISCGYIINRAFESGAFVSTNFFRMADEPNWKLNSLDFDDNSKSRSIDVSKDDVDKFIAQQENEIRLCTDDLNIALKYLREVSKEDRELGEIPPENILLVRYAHSREMSYLRVPR